MFQLDLESLSEKCYAQLKRFTLGLYSIKQTSDIERLKITVQHTIVDFSDRLLSAYVKNQVYQSYI